MERGSKNFGYIPEPADPRDFIFSAPQAMCELPKEFSYQSALSPVLNQGNDPICVPCSCSAYLCWRENLEAGGKQDFGISLWDIYNSRSETKYDGMTFKDALGFLRKTGVESKVLGKKILIKEYSKVTNPVDLRKAILMNGPCLGALPVCSYRESFWKGSYVMGYHAISLVGYTEKGFIIRNSWGEGFGKKGYALLPESDFKKLVETWTVL